MEPEEDEAFNTGEFETDLAGDSPGEAGAEADAAAAESGPPEETEMAKHQAAKRATEPRARKRSGKVKHAVTVVWLDGRPHALLCTLEEAQFVAVDLHESGAADSDITIREAGRDEGMPMPEGEYRPWVIQFMDTHPVTMQSTLISVPGGLAFTLLEAHPEGRWVKSHDGRTLTRVTSGLA